MTAVLWIAADLFASGAADRALEAIGLTILTGAVGGVGAVVAALWGVKAKVGTLVVVTTRLETEIASVSHEAAAWRSRADDTFLRLGETQAEISATLRALRERADAHERRIERIEAGREVR